MDWLTGETDPLELTAEWSYDKAGELTGSGRPVSQVGGSP